MLTSKKNVCRSLLYSGMKSINTMVPSKAGMKKNMFAAL